ncbi:Eco57I restriction-modification methylase domain-containing protein [Cupriavidus necator]
MSIVIDWWSSLKHGGLLIAPDRVASDLAAEPAPLPAWRVERLRRAVTAFDGSNEQLGALLDFVLHDLAALPDDQWQKAQAVDACWSLRSFTGALIKPRRLWQGPQGEVLPVFVPDDGASRQFSGRLGVGRSRQLLSRVVEWLRQKQQPLALVTNGRQWRLVHVGQDYDAWCEWDIDLWFVEGAPGPQVMAWRQLISRDALACSPGQAQGPLLSAILASRKGQADLSAVLGERVRQAVEELITASHGAIEQAQQAGTAPTYADLYVAGSRIVMRCIITLFAEARNLLPVDNPIYQRAYSLEGLRQHLDRRATGRGNDRLSQSRSAWPRLMALFRLIHEGSSHEALPVPHYSGSLFAPGDASSKDGIARALALLEGPQNAVTDRQVQRMLRLLTRTRMRVRQGRSNKLVDAPVDFSALSSEYIGILYEGLLDFELKQAAADDPVIFLAVGNEPALTLSQLEGMSDAVIKQLFDALNKKDKAETGEDDGGDAGDDGDEGEEGNEAPDDGAGDEADTGTDDDEAAPEDGNTARTQGPDDDLILSRDHLARAQAWLERAAVIAGLVKKPRGRRAANAATADDAKALAKATRSLCARQVAPGQFYLVRWGGTRKGAGTFYTRPQLAAPTVRRALQSLAYEPMVTEVDPRTGLTEVVAWQPRRPEAILALKVCDPAMGSGSFLAGALRYLTDALVASLYHHKLIERAEDGGVPRMADGQISEVLSDELLKLRPTDEGFEDALRAQLKRHIVERCLYGVDLDPLAVELGRMALWVETMDRDLPFGFLDHKLKVGNALVGTWFDTYRDYPALAWEREGGDKDYQKDKPQNLVSHFYTDARGKKRGDKFTAAIGTRGKAVPEQLVHQLSGQMTLGGALEASEVHDELLKVFRKLHRLPVHDSDRRAAVYRDEVLANPHYHALKARMDLWCALWFWPGEYIELAPLPQQFGQPATEALALAAEVAAQRRFFHWELEFPDAFTASQQGFDALLGNPPWEIQKPSSKEFFSNHDPLYRAYGKQEALAKQIDYFKSTPKLEHEWIAYVGGLKAMSNWVKCVGQPFGDRVVTDKDGKKKHDLNLGGRGRDSFAVSQRLHDKWLAQRKKRKGFADSHHPFVHQGSADLNTYKMFLELSHALMRPHGRMGMIVPSGIYTDKGTTGLRELFLDHCDWQWLFGFENREGIFDIHRSFKFCPLVIQKTGSTQAIRAAFMHRNVDDWAAAEQYVLAYPREQVVEFSPYSKAILEIRSELDLRVLQKIYANGVLLGDKSERGWGVKYAREFDMTNDSKLFPPRPKWEEKGYQPDEYGHWLKGPWQTYDGPANILDRPAGLVLSLDGRQALHVDHLEDVALPLFQGGMINIFDKNASGYVSKVSSQATWMALEFGAKKVLPQFLVGRRTCLDRADKCKAGLKLAFRDIARNTDTRSAIGSLISGFPCGNTLGVFSGREDSVAAVGFAFSTIAFDWLVRKRLGGTHINLFVAEECAVSQKFRQGVNEYTRALLGLTFPDEMSARVWADFESQVRNHQSWRRLWAITAHERTRLKAILEAVAFHYFGLGLRDARVILGDTDRPTAQLTNDAFCKTLEQRGFWRIDKYQPPELRHPVLALIALQDLEARGLAAFLSQNEGEGWLLPETLRLSDYGLGHDDRAAEMQPVATALGPRFLDWQLSEDVERSWDECAKHAELIRRIVPTEADGESENTDEHAYENEVPIYKQGGLF